MMITVDLNSNKKRLNQSRHGKAIFPVAENNKAEKTVMNNEELNAVRKRVRRPQ